MTNDEVAVLLERAKERYPEARLRIISDSGPQFVAKHFKSFIRHSGMTHVRTSPYYPQSNGKLERSNKSIGRVPVVSRRETPDRAVCDGVQRTAAAQRDWIHHAAGLAGGPAGGDSRRAGPDIRDGAATAGVSGEGGFIRRK